MHVGILDRIFKKEETYLLNELDQFDMLFSLNAHSNKKIIKYWMILKATV